MAPSKLSPGFRVSRLLRLGALAARSPDVFQFWPAGVPDRVVPQGISFLQQSLGSIKSSRKPRGGAAQ